MITLEHILKENKIYIKCEQNNMYYRTIFTRSSTLNECYYLYHSYINMPIIDIYIYIYMSKYIYSLCNEHLKITFAQ